jgi:hypothetical protein
MNMGLGNRSWFRSIYVRGVYVLCGIELLHVVETRRAKLRVIILKILMIHLDGFITSIYE